MRHIVLASAIILLASSCGSSSKSFLWHWPDGQKLAEVGSRRGKEHGLYQGWHANGKRACEGRYKNGKKVGEWIHYDSDGNYVLYRKTYVDGVEVELRFF